MTEQNQPHHEDSFLGKYQYWIIGALCLMALSYEIYQRATAPTPSEQLAETGFLAVLEVAYEDSEELAADLAEMDRRGKTSDIKAAGYLFDTIYPKLYDAYHKALVNAPAAPLEDNHRLSMEMLDIASRDVPEICDLVLELDVNFASVPLEIASDVMAALTTRQKARARAMAAAISQSRSAPEPLEVSERQAINAYDMAFARAINEAGKRDLLNRAMQGKTTLPEKCELIALAGESVNMVPDEQRPLILKGMMLAPFAKDQE